MIDSRGYADVESSLMPLKPAQPMVKTKGELGAKGEMGALELKLQGRSAGVDSFIYLCSDKDAEASVLVDAILKSKHRSIRVDSVDSYGYGFTALHAACFARNAPVARILLINGYDAVVNRKNSYSESSLHLVAGNGDLTIFQMLHRHGANLELTGEEDRTPLHYAGRCGHLEIAKYLLEQNVSKDARDRGNRTPMHLAARYGQTEMVYLLNESGCSQQALDDNGKTPTYIAFIFGHTEICDYLSKCQLIDETTNMAKISRGSIRQIRAKLNSISQSDPALFRYAQLKMEGASNEFRDAESQNFSELSYANF